MDKPVVSILPAGFSSDQLLHLQEEESFLPGQNRRKLPGCEVRLWANNCLSMSWYPHEKRILQLNGQGERQVEEG